jgi:hypothetical protein
MPLMAHQRITPLNATGHQDTLSQYPSATPTSSVLEHTLPAALQLPSRANYPMTPFFTPPPTHIRTADVVSEEIWLVMWMRT